MARTVYTANEGGLKFEFGEYSSGTFAKTYAVPTSLRTCFGAFGFYEGSTQWDGGGSSCVSSTGKTITNFSICSAGGSYMLDFSIADASAGITPNCLVYFAVGY